MVNSFFGIKEATIPDPRGAGIKRTRTEPHLPDTLQGTVWGAPVMVKERVRGLGLEIELRGVGLGLGKQVYFLSFCNLRLCPFQD
jgi:hypothetical protein